METPVNKFVTDTKVKAYIDKLMNKIKELEKSVEKLRKK